MSLEAINEQLLRAIGVGVALLDRESLQFGFYNDTFEEWFGGEALGAALRDDRVPHDAADLDGRRRGR